MVENKIQTFLGFTPFSYQRDVIKEVCDCKGTGKTVTVKSRRQAGKSLLAENVLLYYAINHSKSKNALVSPTFNQAKKVYTDILKAIEPTGIVRRRNASELIIILTNGSQITFHSAAQKEALRGYTVTGILIVDEAAYISDDVWYIIQPWLNAHNAVCMLISSPFTRQGFFYQYYVNGLNGVKNYKTIDWSDGIYKEDMQFTLPQSKLDELSRVIPKMQFRSEYLGEWLDDDGLVFTNYKHLIYNNQIKDNDELYIGIDWGNGTGNDDTAISIVNGNGEQVYLEYWNDLNTTQQIEKIVQIVKPLQNSIKNVTCEYNSLGKPLTELLQKDMPHLNYTEFITTNDSKNMLVSNLQVAFQKESIRLLDDAKQVNELSTYAMEINPKTKSITYNAVQGCCDDICIALMLSWESYLNNKNVSYNFLLI